MRGYVPRLRRLAERAKTFAAKRAAFLNDRYGASHFLLPVLVGDANAFFANGDDPELQGAWAFENGVKADSSLEDILLAQIEAHGAEVFYNLDPVRFPSAFLQRLPGCVKRKIAWSASPAKNADFSAYDRLLCNFPSLIADYEARGLSCAYFTPSHDPVMDEYAKRRDRPIDVLFVGGYSQYHMNRAAILDAVAELGGTYKIAYHMYRSRLTRLSDTPLGWVGPLTKYRTPRSVLNIAKDPVFGRDYYDVLSRSKIVLNIATEIAGEFRGNMRCWEAMGSAGLLLTDEGVYPEGMNETNMATYSGRDEVVKSIRRLLDNPDDMKQLSNRGHEMIRTEYSKQKQWEAFQALL